MMRLRAQVGSRWFFALSDGEQKKLFEDLRYTVDMGLDDAYTAVQWLGNQPDRLKVESTAGRLAHATASPAFARQRS